MPAFYFSQEEEVKVLGTTYGEVWRRSLSFCEGAKIYFITGTGRVME
jgi:hypothetical protein